MRKVNIVRRNLRFRVRQILKWKSPDVDLNQLMEDNRCIVIAVIAGVAVSSLLLGMANLNAVNKVKTKIDYPIWELDGDDIGVFNEEKTGFTSEIEQLLSQYVSEYIASNDITQLFSEETKNSISQEVADRVITKLLETTSLNSVQEKEIREIISEKISQIDYSELKSEFATQLESVKTDSESERAALNEKLTALIAGKIESAVLEVTNDFQSNDTAIKIAMTNLQKTMEKDIQDKYDELLLMINTTNGRISDPENGSYFQYGFDKNSGAAGYYINGEFKPF